jgi:excisionase family DNA binding protein
MPKQRTAQSRPMVIEPGRRYSKAEAAAALHVSPQTLDRDVREGQIHAERFRSRVLFSGEELLRQLGAGAA